MCARYKTDTATNVYNNVNNKSISIANSNTDELLRVRDEQITSQTDFQTAMNGVMLYYELATPVEVELATPVYAKYLVDKDGTEEVSPANGTTPYTTIANLSILYAMDARGVR